jgi:hypothetical protein
MSLLQKATVEQAWAKFGGFGPQGSGKTTTLALLLIGLSKTFHNSAPVACFATEPGVDFIVPIFDAEGVPLLVVKSRAFKDMRQALSEAVEAGCCGYLVDSYTHPWKELCDTFKTKRRATKIAFEDMDALKTMWQGWTDQMLAAPLHVALSGRLGNVWDRQEDEQGKLELVRLGSKMKGESEAGYEPSLLFEMEGLQSASVREKKTRTRRGSITHQCYVLKDRWRVLNGKTFSFPDINEYKPGDYKRIFTAFRPHFDRLAIGGTHRAVDGTRTSESILPGREDFGAEWRRRKDIALEEIRESIAAVFPGQSAGEKRARQVVLEVLFDTLAWSKVEALPLDTLEAIVPVLIEFRGRAASDRDELTTEPGIRSMLQVCRDVVRERADLDAELRQSDDVPV